MPVHDFALRVGRWWGSEQLGTEGQVTKMTELSRRVLFLLTSADTSVPNLARLAGAKSVAVANCLIAQRLQGLVVRENNGQWRLTERGCAERISLLNAMLFSQK